MGIAGLPPLAFVPVPAYIAECPWFWWRVGTLPIHEFHDRSYKLLLDHSKTVWDLLTGFIGGDPADLLDERTLEQMPAEYVDESLIGSRGDMLWRVRFHGASDEWLYLLVLLELQSTVDTHMAVRVAAFIGRIYLRLVRNGRTGPRGRLPPVLPVVLYNGHPSWTAATDMRDLVVRAEGRLEELQLRSGYVLLDVHRMGVGDLPPDNVVSLRVRLERESVRQWPGLLDEAVRILSGSEHESLRRAFAETVRQMVGRGRIAELRPDLVERLREPADRGDIGAMRTILDRSVDEIEQRGFARGREQGREQGLEQGLEQGREQGLEQGLEQGREQGLEQHRATLSRLAARRFGDGTAADLTEVLRGVNDPGRLTDMSELVLDCATGGELLAGAQRIAGRK